LIFYSNTKLPTMNYSYFLRIFWCCLWGIIFEGSKFQLKKYCQAHASASEAYIKKITVACSTNKGDRGRLTIVVNKCSIVRNAPCRMNMHPSGRPDPCPLLLPRSELHRCRPPVLPRRRSGRTTPIRLEVHVRGAGSKVAGAVAITPSAWI
jgi:hypothetical protein